MISDTSFVRCIRQQDLEFIRTTLCVSDIEPLVFTLRLRDGRSKIIRELNQRIRGQFYPAPCECAECRTF